MKEKVFLNRVNVDWQDLYTQAQKYFDKYGVHISFDFVQSNYHNLGYQVEELQGVGARTLLKPQMATVVPIDFSYDFSSFVFNGREFPPPNIPTGCCYNLTGQPFLEILTDELNPPGLNYTTILHEHMHALVQKARMAGFMIPDYMDIDKASRLYYLNNEPENPLSNFGQTWEVLQPYLNSLKPVPVNTVSATITRLIDDGKQTLGHLRTSDGLFGCDTLELAWKNNQPNISCIPKGDYLVKWVHTLRFPFGVYQIQNVPGRNGIDMHVGNFFFNSQGCIILGSSPQDINKDGEKDLINSSLITKAFENKMLKKDFQLHII